MMQTLDLTCMGPEEAARALHQWCREHAAQRGQDPDIEVSLWTPDEAAQRGYGPSWRVSWEAGPYDWGVALTLGGSAFAPERDDYSYQAEPEVKMLDAQGWYGEPHYGFDVGFIEC